MNNEDYHLRPELGCSMLKPFAAGDRRKFEGYYVTRQVPVPDISGKRDVQIGTLVHKCLLEKKDPADLVVFYPQDCLKSNGAINPKPASEFRERMQLQGKTVVKDDVYHQLIMTCNAVIAHDLGRLIEREDVQFEVPIFWTDTMTGQPCKARPDFMFTDEEVVVCCDLKVTQTIHPKAWARTARKLMYWLQDAHYSSGLSTIHGKPVQFVFWVVEACWPYRIACYEYDQISRERSFEAYNRIIRDLKSCHDSGDFSESWEQEKQYLLLEPWDVDGSDEEELEGFDDE